MLKKIMFLLTVFSVGNTFAAANKQLLACKTPVAELSTSLGVIQVQLNPQKAPVSVENFVNYVNSGFYNGKIFHRVISGFMIQGGGFDKNMVEASTNAPIKNEADNGLSNDKYTISMARTSIPDSATAQFFINTVDNPRLNFTAKTDSGWGYAVFGKVIKGTNVVDKISAVATGSVNGYQDVPLTPVVINSAKMLPCSNVK